MSGIISEWWRLLIIRQEHLQGTATAQSASLTPAQHRKDHVLRLTGMPEEEGETSERLEQRVHMALERLPVSTDGLSAKRMGRPGGTKARPVVITFATAEARSAVLRSKSILNRHDDTKSYSINVQLTHQEQQHKNALWQIFVQARQAGRRASFQGCNLFVDGQLVPGPLQAQLHCDQQPMHMPGPVSDQASLPMAAYPADTPSRFFSNPLASNIAFPHASQQQQQQYEPAWANQQQMQPQFQQPFQAQPMGGHFLKTPPPMRPQ